MEAETDIPLSSEAELDRQMSEIIAKWVERGVRAQEMDRYQELSMRRANLMSGAARIWTPGRRHAAA
jgi:hypothetical protein